MMVFVIFIHFNIYIVRAEIFTAAVDLEKLVDAHKRLTHDLDNYVRKEDKRLSSIRRYVDIVKREQEKAMKDVSYYVSHPINAFVLIKRLTIDLELVSKANQMPDYGEGTGMYHKEVEYPTPEDLKGAAEALVRLQETYQLDIKELADGNLNGIAHSSHMSASDCYLLGELLYDEDHFKNGRQWMKQALRKHYQENIDYEFSHKDILQNIVYGYYKLGHWQNALHWTHKLLDIDSTNMQVIKNVHYFQNKIAEEEENKIKHRSITSRSNKKSQTYKRDESKRDKKFEALCRGDIDIPIEVLSRLTCRYLTEKHPFLKIAPIKIMEMLYINPDIVLFYDVFYDDEIKVIRKMATPRLKRSEYHADTSEPVTAPDRISKYEWIMDQESDVIRRVSRRVTHMTGLSMDTSEPLQISNYGIGGFYTPHYDFIPEEYAYKVRGNRIATMMFYMSDVTQGGATVFPKIGLRVLPKKGTAIFWYNLHASGKYDLATYHAACPVLQGSKWVGNKWIHSFGQEFRRPCDLEYQEENIISEIVKPVLNMVM